MGRWPIITAVVVLCISAPPLRAGQAQFDLFIDPQFGSTENTGATARVHFQFTDGEGLDLLTLTLLNTTPPQIGSRLTAVGLEIPPGLPEPSLLTLGLSTGYFDILTFDASVVPPWLDAPRGYDLMLTGEGRFLGGNPHNSPAAGESESVVLAFGDTGLSPEALADAFERFYGASTHHVLIGRFRSVGGGGKLSDKVAGGIPEPGTLLLMAAAGLAFAGRHPKNPGRTRPGRVVGRP